jgi:hypothetical protein
MTSVAAFTASPRCGGADQVKETMMIAKAEGMTPQRPADVNDLLDLAAARLRQGLAPPREIYLVQNRNAIDWSQFPAWARPIDPEIFDGCCHEG